MTKNSKYLSFVKPLIMSKKQFSKKQCILIDKIKNFTNNLFINNNQIKPDIIILNHDDINASICFSPLIIFIHKGCIEKLRYTQLQGMVAHELGHLLNRKYNIKNNSLESEVRADDMACKVYKLQPLLSFLIHSKIDFIQSQHQKYITYLENRYHFNKILAESCLYFNRKQWNIDKYKMPTVNWRIKRLSYLKKYSLN